MGATISCSEDAWQRTAR